MQKNSIWQIWLVLVIMLFCGCDESHENTQYDISQISRVSFVMVASDGNIDELELLDQEELASFVHDFSKLQCYKYWNDPIDSVIGSAILITFQDDTYHLINNYCTIHYKEGISDDTRQCYTLEDFSAFWAKYCSHEYQLP